MEIIIIDSSSEDNTLEIARSFSARTITIPRKDFNHGKTRNIAAMEAKGDIIVFMTQDALPSNDRLLSTLTAPLEKPDIAATYARQIPRDDASPLEVFTRFFNYPALGITKGREDIPKYGIKTFFFSNVCSAIKKDLFLSAGKFPEGIRHSEDMLLAAKLIIHGCKVSYVPEAMVIHSHNYSLSRQFTRYYTIASSLRNNNWIFEYVRPESEGMRFIKEQVRFVFTHREYLWIPYILLESVAKYAGYRIGLIAG
jgi:rhamnosyltransferase